MTIDEIRDQFPHIQNGIYLNHAGSAPLSVPVVAAINEYVEQRHRSNVENWEILESLIEETRRWTARLIGSSPAEIEFVQNTSDGLSILAEGLDWRPGDRIAIPGCEFPANVYPFLNLRRHGVHVDLIPHEEACVDLDAIARNLRPETRLLSISWVQFLSGDRADLAAIGQMCRANSTIFCVDAIQGLGAVRLDVEDTGIDFLSTGTQKWMMGVRGFGFIYVSSDLQSRLRPRVGWLHGPTDWDDFFDYELRFHPDARRFALGTMNMIGMVALRAALAFFEEVGHRRVEESILANAAYLARRLDEMGVEPYGREMGTAPQSGIVTSRVLDAAKTLDDLKSNGITASVRNGLLRLAPSFYHLESELETALETIQGSNLRPRGLPVGSRMA
jgi:cysteine desulfurase / selenocysteine lyase